MDKTWKLCTSLKGELQICPCMSFNNNLYVEYLSHNNYRNEIILINYYISRRLLDVHLFVLAYDLLNIGLKSLALMTATFFE